MRRFALTVLLVAAINGAAVPLMAHTAPIPRSGHCNLTTGRDLIIWTRWPGVPDFATKNGDVDLVHCKPTLDGWRDWEQTGPGYCAKIAWASDNPGYDINVRPAPLLKKVIDEVGDC
jgi:hypothetical protein